MDLPTEPDSQTYIHSPTYNVTTDYIKRKGGCGLMDRLFPPVSGEKMAKLLYSLKFLYLKLLGHSSEIRGFFSI